jgi:hypothetical protein
LALALALAESLLAELRAPGAAVPAWTLAPKAGAVAHKVPVANITVAITRMEGCIGLALSVVPETLLPCVPFRCPFGGLWPCGTHIPAASAKA